jgi:hypothetical protein
MALTKVEGVVAKRADRAYVAVPLGEVAGDAGAEELAIRSRWQHDAVPPWRPAPRGVSMSRNAGWLRSSE